MEIAVLTSPRTLHRQRVVRKQLELQGGDFLKPRLTGERIDVGLGVRATSNDNSIVVASQRGSIAGHK